MLLLSKDTSLKYSGGGKTLGRYLWRNQANSFSTLSEAMAEVVVDILVGEPLRAWVLADQIVTEVVNLHKPCA